MSTAGWATSSSAMLTRLRSPPLMPRLPPVSGLPISLSAMSRRPSCLRTSNTRSLCGKSESARPAE